MKSARKIIRTCIDCGAGLSHNGKRCKPCASVKIEADREANKERRRIKKRDAA